MIRPKTTQLVTSLREESCTLYKGAGGSGKYCVQSLQSHDISSDHGKSLNKWIVDKENADKPLATMMKTVSAKLDDETKSSMERLFKYCSLCGKGRSRLQKIHGFV